MTWTELLTPPSPRPPPPKAPLFTRKFQSTKSFSPGHLVGAGILVLGVWGITKLFVARAKDEAERSRRLADSPPRPSLAQASNDRGQYGRKQ